MTIYFLKDSRGRYYTSNSVNGFLNGAKFEDARFYTRLGRARGVQTKLNNDSKKVSIFSLEIDENHAIHCG